MLECAASACAVAVSARAARDAGREVCRQKHQALARFLVWRVCNFLNFSSELFRQRQRGASFRRSRSGGRRSEAANRRVSRGRH